MTERFDVILNGCRPFPLAHYLKALAVHRLVSEQVDSGATAWWSEDSFILRSTLDAKRLVTFLSEDYRPTPVIAPWNGGSGFNPKDNTDAIDAIRAGESPRHALYREVIEGAHAARDGLGISDKVDKSLKEALLTRCRSTLPEVFLNWFDAAIVLTESGPTYPPILGTGGNDGRLDFTNNYMQRLNDVIDPHKGQCTPISERMLESSLFSTPVDGLLRNQAIGQFAPSLAGGANSAAGLSGETILNPWDFILMIEGAVMFAASTSRRLGQNANGTFSAPFTVQTTGAGYGSASSADEASSRAEIWLPMWERPTTHAEIARLFSDGRATVAGRDAMNGSDFARAVSTLGTDRGVSSFQRVGFQKRNGLAYFAISLGRVHVEHRETVGVLDEADRWLDVIRRQVDKKGTPGRVSRAGHQLQRAIFAFANTGAPTELEALVLALGETEAALAGSFSWTSTMGWLRPLQLKDPRWLSELPESIELRLAHSLASVWGLYGSESISIRQHLEPVIRKHGQVRWAKNPGRNVVWTHTQLVDDMLAVLLRRAMLTSRENVSGWPDRGIPAALPDICAFVEGHTDDHKLARLFRALTLIDSSPSTARPNEDRDAAVPGAAWGVMRLAFTPEVAGQKIPVHPQILRLGANGESSALTLAARRLRASGVPPAVDALKLGGNALRRITASLLFPISKSNQRNLERDCLARHRLQAG